MDNKIGACIVTYNPDIERLQENICAIKPQVLEVCIVDNDSNNVELIEKLCKKSNICLLKNERNEGMGYALNRGARYIQSRGGGYLLTLDQDSVVSPSIIDSYINYIDLEGVASITSLRKDRDFTPKQESSSEGYLEVSKCITSGNLINLDIWREIGGFNEKLFIDMVDTEFCYRVRRAGYKIICINKYCMVHELGNAFHVRFLGRDRTVLNHNAFRRYYIFRNTVYMLRRYQEAHSDYSYTGLAKTFIAALLYEDDKWNKARASIIGMIDGMKLK